MIPNREFTFHLQKLGMLFSFNSFVTLVSLEFDATPHPKSGPSNSHRFDTFPKDTTT
jgi:hypothetical protein